jgi:trehalose 6-phosphate phosphatase
LLTDAHLLHAALPSAVVALDFDGALAAISPHPTTHVRSFGAVPGIVIYGLQGVERWENGQLRAPAPPPGMLKLRRSLPGLLASIAHDDAIGIEDKQRSLVIHTRLTAEPDRLLEVLRVPVAEAAAAAGLEARLGKEVLETCIPGIGKATAIRELIGEDTMAVFYAGDDIGDLPAVQEVNAWSDRNGHPSSWSR